MIRISAESLWAATENQGFWARLADQMAAALREQAADRAASSPRQIIRTSIGNGLGVMAAIAEQSGKPLMGVKIVSLAQQTDQGGPSHPGAVILIDPVSGEPLACLDADAVTALRTAATTCAVTRHLRPEAARFAIIGTGTEARSHLLALSAAYPEARFMVWGRRAGAASEIATKYASEGIAVFAEPDLTKALRDADVITSLTAARSPFLEMRYVGEAAHVNAIGASIPGLAEWAPESFSSIDVLICDSVLECERQSGEVPLDLLSSAWNASAILEKPPSTIAYRDGKRTVYKSVGSAVLDVTAGAFLVDQIQPPRDR